MGKFPAPAAFSGRFFPLLSHRSGGNSNRKWGVCTLILNKIGPQIPHPLGEAAPAAKSFPVWAPKSIGILGMLGVLGDGMSCGCGCGWGYHRQPPNRRAAALQLVGRKSLARGQGILPLEFVVGIPGEHMDRAGNGGFSAGKGSFSREKEGSALRAPPKCVERGVNPDHPWVSHFLGIKGIPGPGVVWFWVESWIIPGGKGMGMCGEEGKGMESHRQWIFLGFGKVGWKLGKNSGCCGHQGCPGVAALKYSSMMGLENIP